MINRLEEPKCQFCQGEATLEQSTRFNGSIKVVCRFCGTYYATEEFLMYAGWDGSDILINKGGSDPVKYPLHNVQGAIQEYSLKGKTPNFAWDSNPAHGFTDLGEFMRGFEVPKNPSQKIDKLLQNLDKAAHSRVGKGLDLNYDQGGSWCYAQDTDEFVFILKSANDIGYFSEASFPTGKARVVLSLEAWNRIESLKQANEQSRFGFVACWFETPPNPNNQAIVDGITNAGYEPIILQGKHFSETIISKALSDIKRSRFVVVDLTGQRYSVFFEAGFALGRGIDVIFVIERKYWDANKKDLEFYVKNYNIKAYEDAEQLEDIVKSAIKERID